MAIVYRLQNIKYNKSTFSGEGAFLTGGRWNEKGTPVIYTSSTISLTILEMQVHIDKTQLHLLPRRNFVEIEVPDECIHEFEQDELPVNWNSIPVIESTQQFLLPYFESGNKLAFKVPSVVNPYEYNLLINPLHPDIKYVVVKNILDFVIDPRFFVSA